jgi:hypothetical protein
VRSVHTNSCFGGILEIEGGNRMNSSDIKKDLVLLIKEYKDKINAYRKEMLRVSLSKTNPITKARELNDLNVAIRLNTQYKSFLEDLYKRWF